MFGVRSCDAQGSGRSNELFRELAICQGLARTGNEKLPDIPSGKRTLTYALKPDFSDSPAIKPTRGV